MDDTFGSRLLRRRDDAHLVLTALYDASASWCARAPVRASPDVTDPGGHAERPRWPRRLRQDLT